MEILKVEGLTKSYGGLVAVSNLSFSVREGEVVGLIGPNGAGKTTVFQCVSGLQKPTSGRIWFENRRIETLRPDEIARRGLARTFQVVRPFGGLTVLENIMVGCLCRTSDVSVARKAALELAEFGGLAHKADWPVENLTLADKKRLEILKALGTKPKLLLLDETLAGLNPEERRRSVEFLMKVKAERHMTFVIIEHVMDVVMSICERVIVINHGVKIAEGNPLEVSRDEAVIRAYLGEKYRARSA